MRRKVFQVPYGFFLDIALVVGTSEKRDFCSIFQAQHHQFRQQITSYVVQSVNRS
ncbi:Uncharacterised protein [Pseudomonas putida]|nr:Uncharacterised protein [Pseudomonas putida]